jgi:hypothetical protein
VNELTLTHDERRAVFAGNLNVLRRPQRPDQEAGDKVVVSWSKGGRQLLDRKRGKTIDVPREARLWITIKGWHLKAGQTEWETAVQIHDERQSLRVLANGVGGMPREAGLKTRWGKKVIHSQGKVKVVDKRVPSKEEQRENWTAETERGYGGREEMEPDADGQLQPATGVSDAELKRFANEALDKNLKLQMGRRKREEGMRREMKVAREFRRSSRQSAKADTGQKIDVTIAYADRTEEAVISMEGDQVTSVAVLKSTPA